MSAFSAAYCGVGLLCAKCVKRIGVELVSLKTESASHSFCGEYHRFFQLGARRLKFRSSRFLHAAKAKDKLEDNKKLLCIAFDIAINEMHLSENFTHFSFHDGFLENLDS